MLVIENECILPDIFSEDATVLRRKLTQIEIAHSLGCRHDCSGHSQHGITNIHDNFFEHFFETSNSAGGLLPEGVRTTNNDGPFRVYRGAEGWLFVDAVY